MTALTPLATTMDPQSGNLAIKENGIPLLCSVCPKRPKFSDTSHLLTHLNSKGHLANCQQVDLRSQSDPAYKAVKAEYDVWYNKYNLLSLLTERQVAKDQKDARRDAHKKKRPREATAPVSRPATVSLVLLYLCGIT